MGFGFRYGFSIAAAIDGVLFYRGAWDANANNPALASGIGTLGDYYVVDTAGSTLLDGISSWGVGDWVTFNGTVWEKIPSATVVASVFGRTGAVSAQPGDYSAAQVGADPAGTASSAVSAHTAIVDAHHAKYTDGEADSRVAAGIATHEAAADPHPGYQLESEKGSAGGYASLDGSGLIPDSQIPAAIARDSEVSSAISSHTAIAAAHHSRYQDSEAVSAMGANSDGNPLNHDKPTIASQTEVNTGTNDTKIVTPLKLANWTGQGKATREIFTRVEYNSNLGNIRTRSIGGTGRFRFNFFIPDNFGTLVSANLLGVVDSSGATGTGKDIDLFADFGAKTGEAYNIHTASNTTSTYTLPAENQRFQISITSLLSAASAGDSGGIFVDHNGIGGSAAYLGISIKYVPA